MIAWFRIRGDTGVEGADGGTQHCWEGRLDRQAPWAARPQVTPCPSLGTHLQNQMNKQMRIAQQWDDGWFWMHHPAGEMARPYLESLRPLYTHGMCQDRPVPEVEMDKHCLTMSRWAFECGATRSIMPSGQVMKRCLSLWPNALFATTRNINQFEYQHES